MWKNPGTISKGLGKLTPQVWRGVMSAADFVHRNKRDIERLVKYYIQDSRKRSGRPWFLAKLTKGKRVGDNQYVYAWSRVQLTNASNSTSAAYDYSEDAEFTSAEGGDDFAYAAINSMEIENTSSMCAPGVNQSHSPYPEKFMMMPIGGVVPATTGEDPEPALNESFDLVVNPVVQMWFTRTPEFKIRYVFTASNTHDGAECD